jgi:hypothetical protein
MIPLFMRLKVGKPGRKGFGLTFPVILVWILLFALMIVLLPFLLLAALITRLGNGPGFALLLVYPLVFSVLWNLGGLHIETKSGENEVLIAFS